MTRICFVCHGNICRSVSAQYILQDLAVQAGMARGLKVDSAATSTEEIGNEIYPPMRRTLAKRHVPVGRHRARQLTRRDYEWFDLLIGMDEENMYYMKRILGGDPDGKIHYLMEYTGHPEARIDDPWYTRDFETCADQITEGCRGLLKQLEEKK